MTEAWGTGDIVHEPTDVLENWLITEVTSVLFGARPTRHFLGTLGRVEHTTDPIKMWDSARLRGETERGRIYELRGPSNYLPVLGDGWGQFAKHAKILTHADATNIAMPDADDDEPLMHQNDLK